MEGLCHPFQAKQNKMKSIVVLATFSQASKGANEQDIISYLYTLYNMDRVKPQQKQNIVVQPLVLSLNLSSTTGNQKNTFGPQKAML